jgi:hypothetical protein
VWVGFIEQVFDEGRVMLCFGLWSPHGRWTSSLPPSQNRRELGNTTGISDPEPILPVQDV